MKRGNSPILQPQKENNQVRGEKEQISEEKVEDG